MDLAHMRLTVKQSRVQVGYSVKTTTPKSKKTRNVPLPQEAVAVLEAWKEQQTVDALDPDHAWEDSGLVFTESDGSGIHPDAFKRRFDRLVKAAGVKRITPHGCRHTFASNMLRAGVPLDMVSKVLGHSNINITHATYSHVLRDQYDAVRQAQEGLYRPVASV